MKKSSFLYAIFFLLISPAFLFAADVNLKDTSSGNSKTITVEVDTKGEMTNSFKVVVFFSNNVTISGTTKGDFQCGAFSGEQVGSTVEITCTTQGEEAINSSVAKINFTAPTDDYSFTVMKEDSAIGNLAIEDTNNVGIITISADAPAQSADSASSKTETKGIKEYLPYILLGVAGIFLLSIIILVATKGKKNDSTEVTPTEAQVTTPEPILPAATKPTLQEMVNSNENKEVTPVETTPIQESVEPTISTTSNHEEDLEALLISENPGMEAPVPQPTDVLTTPAPEEPPIDNSLGTPELTASYGMPTQEEQPYVANTTEGGLPSIGTQSPTSMASESIETFNQPTDFAMPVSPMSETPLQQSSTTPFTTDTPAQNIDQTYTTMPEETTPFQPEISPATIETPQPEVEDTFSSLNGIPVEQTVNETTTPETPVLSQNSMDMDLQALVNNEVNNIQIPPETPTTVPPQDTTEV